MNKETALGRFEYALKTVLDEGQALSLEQVRAIGPFDNMGHVGMLTEYEVEEDFSAERSYAGRDGDVSWVSMPHYDGKDNEFMDVNVFMPVGDWSAVYIAATVTSDKNQLARLSLEASGMGHAWLNGELILKPLIARQCNMQEDTLFVSLKEGENTLVLKAHYGDEFPSGIFKWQCRGFGEKAAVCEKIKGLLTSTDPMVSLTAKYALTEIAAVMDDDEEVIHGTELICQDPVATEWDVKWTEDLKMQKAWSGSYQPVRDVQRYFEPAENTQPCETLWPQVPETEKEIFVVDVSEESAHVEFAVKVLQGLVNRRSPSLYVVHRQGASGWDYKVQDEKWLDELVHEGYSIQSLSLEEVWEKYGSFAKGAVLYDGAIMDEIGDYRSHQLNQVHVLMMIGSLEDSIPVTSELNSLLGLPVVFDARERWQSQFEIMNYAYRELYPKMNHTILATQYPGKFFLTDYLVAFKIFTFWFPEHRTVPEENLLNGILASTPPNTPIIGWWFDWMPDHKDDAHRNADALQELYGLLHGSFFGKILTPSHEATNLSIHSGVPLMDVCHEEAEIPSYDPSKIYYTNIISDGDNLGEALMMRTRDLHWDKEERGAVPMGWTVAPSAAKMAPTVLNYYLRTCTQNDLLVGGLGVGYTEPTIYTRGFGEAREHYFSAYGKMTDEAMKPLDTNCLWLISGMDHDVDVYAKEANQIEGIFVGYGGGPFMAEARETVNDVIAFRPATVNHEHKKMTRQEHIQAMVGDILAARDRGERFIESWVLNWAFSMDMLVEAGEILGDGFVCVRPDVLVKLRKRYDL